MTEDQIINGFHRYLCPLSRAFSTDTVIISNHPEILQRTASYDRAMLTDWFRSKQTCPVTREPLIAPLLDSIQIEVTMFLLESEKYVDSFPKLDGYFTDEIKRALAELRASNPALIEEATHNLYRLQHNEKVDLSIDSIGNLISFGIPADYGKQNAYALQLNIERRMLEERENRVAAERCVMEVRALREAVEHDVIVEQAHLSEAEHLLRELTKQRKAIEKTIEKEKQRIERNLRHTQENRLPESINESSSSVDDLLKLLPSNDYQVKNSLYKYISFFSNKNLIIEKNILDIVKPTI